MEEKLIVVIMNRVFLVSKDTSDRSPLPTSVAQCANIIIIIDNNTNETLKRRFSDTPLPPEAISILWEMALPVTLDELKTHLIELYPEQKHNPWL